MSEIERIVDVTYTFDFEKQVFIERKVIETEVESPGHRVKEFLRKRNIHIKL